MNTMTELQIEGLNECLLDSCEHGDIHMVRGAIQQGADIHCQNLWGKTPLIVAGMAGHGHIFDYLQDLIDAELNQELASRNFYTR